jgi:hypothetical protein
VIEYWVREHKNKVKHIVMIKKLGKQTNKNKKIILIVLFQKSLNFSWAF